VFDIRGTRCVGGTTLVAFTTISVTVNAPRSSSPAEPTECVSGPGPEQPLTEGGLEKLCLDGLLVVVLANDSDAIVAKQQPLSFATGPA